MTSIKAFWVNAAGRSAQPSSGNVAHLLTADGCAGPDLAVELVRLARTQQHLAFNLGVVAIDAPLRSTLVQLARLRRESGFGLVLECATAAAPTSQEITLMRSAGVATIEVIRPSGEPRDVGVDQPNSVLRQLATVKRLYAADMNVTWQIVEDDSGADQELVALMRLAPDLYHLPPPSLSSRAPASSCFPPSEQQSSRADGNTRCHLPTGMAIGRVQESLGAVSDEARALGRWVESQAPRTVTYSRGPGFVKILDRRAGPREWKFITLIGPQAELYLECEEWRHVSVLRNVVPTASNAAIERLTTKLVDQRVMCCDQEGRYLSTAVRRRVDERWTSGDH